MSKATRTYLYWIAIAVSGIIIGWSGWQAITEQEWLFLINAVFGFVTGTAGYTAERHISDK